MSLATKLIAAIVVLLVATVGAAAFFSARSIETFGRQEAARRRADGEVAMKAQAELVARNLATSAGLPLAEGNFTYLSSLAANTLKDQPRIEWLMISDAASERVVARAGTAPAVERLDDELGRELGASDKVAADAGRVLHRVDPADGSRLVFGGNVTVGERVVGQVRLALSTRDLETALAASMAEAQKRARDSARQLALVAGAILVLGVLIGAHQGMRIIRPLKSLTLAAARIAGGDFGQRAQVTSNDEIGRLATTFNSMSESLGAMLEQMTVKAQLERELELARSVQELMSPPPAPIEIDDLTLAGHCEPATQCGGDWWTFRRLSGGRLLVVIGDVTGHGMPAAMIAATARGAALAYGMTDDRELTPTRVLEAIDAAIRDVGSGRLLMTCFSLMISPARGLVEFANAGHTFPYVARVDAEGRLADLTVLAVNGNPLGAITPCIRAGERELVPGQVILLSTDGLTDRIASTGERYGERRLRKLLQRERLAGGGAQAAEDIRDHILTEMREFAGSQPADDDTTLVVCKFKNGAASVRREAPSSRGAVG